MGMMVLDIGPDEETAKIAIEKLKEGGIIVEATK